MLVALLLAPVIHAADAVDELQRRVEQLSQQLQTLQEQIYRDGSDERLPNEMTTVDSYGSAEDKAFVDLTPSQRMSIDEKEGSNVLSNPWWRNFDISGFGAVGFYDTGSAGTRDKGGFGSSQIVHL